MSICECGHTLHERWDGLTESPEEVIRRNTELTSEVEALRAQVQAVRDLCDRHAWRINDANTYVVQRAALLHILDGGDA